MKSFPVVITSDKALHTIDQYYLMKSVYFSADDNMVGYGNYDILGFQGCGALHDTFVNSNISLNDALLKQSNSREIVDELFKNFRGAGIAYVREKNTENLYIIPDVLGEALVYQYSHDGVNIISGDLLKIEEIAKRLGLPLTKSLDYALELALASNGGLSKSSYREVSTLDMFQYIVVTPRGIVVRTHDVANDFFKAGESYEELLSLAVSEIKQNVLAAANNTSERRIGHLTGGFDSRLVLAAAKSLGVERKFAFYCKGDPVQEDTKIAQSAAAKVGAIMTGDHGNPSEFQTADFGGSLLASMLISSGMLPVGPQRGNSIGNITILSGGYGETFRSFYGVRLGEYNSDERLSGTEFGTKIWGSYLFASDGSGLFSSSFVSKLAAQIDVELDKGRKLGVEESDLSDFLYLQLRNRYFVGIITSNWNRFVNRFDPLYSPSAIRLAFKVSLESRADNIIGFDLMNALCPSLLSVPFDSPKFGMSVARQRGYSSPAEYAHVRPRYDSITQPAPALINSEVLCIPKVLDADIEYARRINTKASQVAGRAHVREALSRVLKKYSTNELEKVFNPIELQQLLGKPANTRVRIRTLYSLFSSLIWLSDDLDRSVVVSRP